MTKKILLVEDDSFILDIYSSQLKKAGFLVEAANNGQKALEKIKNSMPDLLLLDIGLPGMDGWEVLAQLRADARTKVMPVIIISNTNKEDSAGNIAKFSVLKYFLKIETTTEEIVNYIKGILTI